MGNSHLCNVFFEAEVAGFKVHSLLDALKLHPIFFQLQYLPLIYASPEETIFVSDPLPENYLFPFSKMPKIQLLYSSLSKDLNLESWGPSQLIQSFAQERGLTYEFPPWELVEKVASKRFAHELCPLPESCLLENPCNLKTFKGLWVFKKLYATAGRGHLFSTDPQVERLVHKEWEKGNALLAQPWLERLFDFSSQWNVKNDGEISLIGITECQVGPQGRHLSNIVPLCFPYPQLLEAHLDKSYEVLTIMAKLGFFGPVGMDAFLYQSSGDVKLQSIVEINPRKTMGWVALAIQKRYFKGKKIKLSYLKTEKNGLLPPSKSGFQLIIQE